jgi:hypothetical protein
MFSVPKAACGLLVVALAAPATMVRASDEPVAATPAAATPGLRASIERAAQAVGAQPMTALPSTPVAGFASSEQIARVPVALPKPSHARKSATAIVLSLVGTGAGIAGTYYMIKTMRDETKKVPVPGS